MVPPPPLPDALLDDEVAVVVRHRGVSVVLENARQAAIANVFLAVLLVLGNHKASDSAWGWGWVAAVVVVYGGRAWLARRYRRATPEQQHADLAAWSARVVASATASGVVWGGGLIVLWWLGTLREHVLIVMVVSGLLPSAASSLAAVPAALAGYLVPLAAGTGFGMLYNASDRTDFVAVAGLLVLVPLLLRGARTLHDEFARSTRLTLEQVRLTRALERARDEALNAARARADFVSVLSHEVRTPLNGVVGLTEALMETPLTRHQVELARGVRDCGTVLLDVVNEVLDLSRLESGQLELEVVETSVVQEVGLVRSVFERPATEKGLHLDFLLADRVPPWVRVDRFRLRQVLVNLVSNAVKFTVAGSVRATVDAVPDGAGRVRLQVAVQDTGIGLSAEQIAGLFRPFHQGEPSITRRFGGTGLGLAICKQLVERMGGTCGVTSEVGVGSRFFFELPLEVGTGAVPEATTEETPPAPAGGRVLVVDDNEVNVLVASRILQRAGYEVETCGDGREALEMLARHRFDVVVMDLQMPDPDGAAVLARVRTPGAGALDPEVPFVALTAAVGEGDRAAATAAGFAAFLTKPVDARRLVAEVGRLVRERPAPAQAATNPPSTTRAVPLQ